MFDYVCSSYDLGEDFTNVELQTKEIERGIGGTMTHYWIDPSGQLWMIDYRKTHDLVDNDEQIDQSQGWNPPFVWVPNGNHGKISPVYITDYVIVYPSRWEGDYENWPECRIHLINGKIQEFVHLKKGNRSKSINT